MRKGATNWLMIIIALIVIGIFTGYISIEGLRPPVEPGVTTMPEVTCESTITPDYDPNYYQFGTPSTASTSANNIYRKVGDIAWSTWTQGTALTNMELGATYEFIPGTHTTVATSDAESYGAYFTYTVKCQETDSDNYPAKLDEIHSGLTATFYNEDDNAAAQTFSAGDVKTVSLKWKAAKDEFYGNPYIAESPLSDNGQHRRIYPNVLAIKANSTAWEVPVAVSFIKVAADDTPGGTSGTLRRIPCPTIVSADGATTHIMYCYEAPVISSQICRFYLQMEADGTNAPFVDDTAYLYAGHFYINTDTAEIAWGIENNDAAYTAGDGDADSLTLDYT